MALIALNHESNLDLLHSESQNKGTDSSQALDFRPLEAYRKTQKIIKMSLKSEEDISFLSKPIDNFLSIVKKFISNKDFYFDNGVLVVENKYGVISEDKLSSGEKQLLILFIETLLQKNEAYIFLTDEPELSLHIQWQRNIIPAIKSLNPKAQIIAATHSPEVASKYFNYIFDMEKLVYE